MSGWAKQSRDLAEHPIFDGNITRYGVWCRLLVMAAHKKTDVFMNGKTVHLECGQLVVSLRFLAKKMGITHASIRQHTEQLTKQHMIRTVSSTRQTVITICNYSKFQGISEANNTRSNTTSNTVNNTTNNTPVEQEGTEKGLRRERGCRLPSDWVPSEGNIEFAKKRGFSMEQILDIADTFRNHWIAKAGTDAAKRDWDATWRNWVKKEKIKPKINGAKPWVRDVMDGPDPMADTMLMPDGRLVKLGE